MDVRNIDWLLLVQAPTGDQAHNPAMCPDWESNWQPFALWDNAQPSEAHQPGQLWDFLCEVINLLLGC